MKLSYIVVFAVGIAMGCATEEDRRQWKEVMKDWNGENMEMRNDFAGPRSVSTKPPSQE